LILRSRAANVSCTIRTLAGALAFAAALAAGLRGGGGPGAASVARADRVVLLPVGGSASDERREHVEDAIAATLRALGHDVVVGATVQGLPPGPPAAPQSSDEAVRIATANRALWVLKPDVWVLPAQYRLHLYAAYAPVRRVEEIEVLVLDADEQARLRDVLSCLVRAAGLGDDALRLTEGEDPDEARRQREAAEARERERREAEARERGAREQREREERERRAREEHERREREERERLERERQAAFEARLRYADERGPGWLAQVGLAFGGLVSTGDAGRPLGAPSGGGVLADLSLRVGHGVPGVRGFEARGGVDLFWGATGALGIAAGAVYLATPFSFPLHLGGGADVGLLLNTTGARAAGLLLRAMGTVAYALNENVYLEATLPELTVGTIGDGFVSLGGSARFGYRF
jgi:hypothetical protein